MCEVRNYTLGWPIALHGVDNAASTICVSWRSSTRDTPMTAECVIRIRIFDVLAPWQRNRDPSPKGNARPSRAATQTTIWRCTRHGPSRKASLWATTSLASSPQPMDSMSLRTFIATPTSRCCSRPGAKSPRKQASPPMPGRAGGSSHHPDGKEGRSVLACPSVPVRAANWRASAHQTRRACSGLTFSAIQRYPLFCALLCRHRSIWRGDRNGRHRRKVRVDGCAQHVSHHPGRRPVSTPIPVSSSIHRRRDDCGSASSAHLAMGGGPRAGCPSHSPGPRNRERTIYDLVTTGPDNTKGLARILADHGKALRIEKYIRACLHTSVHREGTANERIRAHLG